MAKAQRVATAQEVATTGQGQGGWPGPMARAKVDGQDLWPGPRRMARTYGQGQGEGDTHHALPLHLLDTPLHPSLQSTEVQERTEEDEQEDDLGNRAAGCSQEDDKKCVAG